MILPAPAQAMGSAAPHHNLVFGGRRAWDISSPHPRVWLNGTTCGVQSTRGSLVRGRLCDDDDAADDDGDGVVVIMLGLRMRMRMRKSHVLGQHVAARVQA